MVTQFSAFSVKGFYCELCDFGCFKKSEWDRHIATKKHIDSDDEMQNSSKKNKRMCECGKEYAHRQGLYTHKKLCKFLKNGKSENVVVDNKPEIVIPEPVIAQDPSNNDVIQQLIKENSDFKGMIMELMKSNTDFQKQILDVCQKMQPSNTINNNNTLNDNSNKTFNLQVFLNEKCKNAMNLDDFANSIELKLSDLIRIGEEGYIPGMSKVFIERLVNTEICKRPIHCSDEKREAIQVKMADKWERESINSENLMNAVRIVEKKQFNMINTFRDTYPECMNSESHHNDMLIKLFQNLSNSREPEFIKVIKKVAKSVVIDKENNA